MADYAEEFKKDIPYLADEISHAIGGGSDSWTIDEVYHVVERILEDWLKNKT